MNLLVVVIAVASLAACSSNASAPSRPVIVDDSKQGQILEHFAYTGAWEHLHSRGDGRFQGTSSRSHHPRDSVVFPFIGSIVRLYGVRGPNGGNASVGIDGRYYGTATFFAPVKQVHALVFESPPLANGAHTLGVVVNGDTGNSHRVYVNLDDAEIFSKQ